MTVLVFRIYHYSCYTFFRVSHPSSALLQWVRCAPVSELALWIPISRYQCSHYPLVIQTVHLGFCDCHITLSVTALLSFCLFNQDVWWQPESMIFIPCDRVIDFWIHFSVSWWQVRCRYVLETCQCFSNPHMTSTGCQIVQKLLLNCY